MTGERLTVGIVTPHAAAGPEVELPAMTRGRVVTLVSRTDVRPEVSGAQRTAAPARVELRASTEAAAIERAAAAFGHMSLTAVAHASTTTGYVIGERGEAALVGRLADRFGVPGVATCAAVVAALRAHEVGRVQLVHPPWFDEDFDELGTAYFQSQGFEAAATRAMDLPADPADVQPQHVVDWVERNLAGRAEAIFLAGNGFRAAEAIEDLELRTGRLVLGANQALLWGVLAAAGPGRAVTGYGRVLRDLNGT